MPSLFRWFSNRERQNQLFQLTRADRSFLFLTFNVNGFMRLALYRQMTVHCTVVYCVLYAHCCRLHTAHCWFGWTEYWILNTYLCSFLSIMLRFNFNLWMQQQSLNAIQGYALSLNSSQLFWVFLFPSIASFFSRFTIFEIQFELFGFVKNFTNLFNSKQSFRNERFNNFSAFFLEFILLYIFIFIFHSFYLFPFSVAYRMVRAEQIEKNKIKWLFQSYEICTFRLKINRKLQFVIQWRELIQIQWWCIRMQFGYFDAFFMISNLFLVFPQIFRLFRCRCWRCFCLLLLLFDDLGSFQRSLEEWTKMKNQPQITHQIQISSQKVFAHREFCFQFHFI